MPTRRKPGGQPGNINALKSGYFSRRFTPLELSDLETVLHSKGLDSAINLMHVQIRRLQEIANGEDTKQDLTETLNTLGTACVRLASLLRTDQTLARRQTDIAALLTQAIEEVYGNALDPRKP